MHLLNLSRGGLGADRDGHALDLFSRATPSRPAAVGPMPCGPARLGDALLRDALLGDALLSEGPFADVVAAGLCALRREIRRIRGPVRFLAALPLAGGLLATMRAPGGRHDRIDRAGRARLPGGPSGDATTALIPLDGTARRARGPAARVDPDLGPRPATEPDTRGPDQRGPDQRDRDQRDRDHCGPDRRVVADHPAPGGRADAGPTPDAQVMAELVGRARRGEREAFGMIYDQYADFVFRYAYYRVGGNRAVAEDVVSETFLRALLRISSFEWQGRDIGAWLITIARNYVVDLARSGRARLEFPTADLLTAADTRAVPGPEDAVLAALDSRRLIEAMRALGAEQRECVTLRFLEGLSVRETAEAMNKKEGAVRALQLRAVRALARRLPAPEPD